MRANEKKFTFLMICWHLTLLNRVSSLFLMTSNILQCFPGNSYSVHLLSSFFIPLKAWISAPSSFHSTEFPRLTAPIFLSLANSAHADSSLICISGPGFRPHTYVFQTLPLFFMPMSIRLLQVTEGFAWVVAAFSSLASLPAILPLLDLIVLLS